MNSRVGRAIRPAGKRARIMVVDDDPDTLTILVHYIRREGFDAIGAGSGTECLKLAAESKVDVILLDLMMPEMDGFEVCRILKATPATAETPIILVTALDDIDARAEAMRLGVSEFLAKPVGRLQLVNRINAQLEMVAAARSADLALERFQRGS
ncbi:MAG: response regulator [Candidatus Binataceae bacterium]